MKEIAILLHEDAVLSTVSGAMDMLIHTNRLFQESGKPLPFKIMLVGKNAENQFLRNPEPYVGYSAIADLNTPDLIIVPAFYGDRGIIPQKHQTPKWPVYARAVIFWPKPVYFQGGHVPRIGLIRMT
jgi:hypothetical protein